ncbi:phage Gp37/Gp68 family protein [Sphingomonas sp. Leaf208]|uniref:phage Gp37/Gp68 family protein n=1 Tax=Sphingomonas sp. Leaf208 TaxID=1735679 RepID=UPI000ACD2B2B|nr:phage Gp37/Gp68 family protein [Sphingomonas sp. Leaf208]
MSQIEWTDQTWNPMVGCSRLSAGCDHCYAIKMAHRFNHTHYQGLTAINTVEARVDWTGFLNTAPPHIFNKPESVKKPTVWFVNSMSDMFHEDARDDDIIAAFKIMNECKHHTFQVLTKRPSRMALKTSELGLKWTANIWAGTSIEEDKYTKPRVRELLKVPAKLRFVSAEPLLGPLPSLEVEKLDWLIVGGESGQENTVRAMDPSWVRDLLKRCRAGRTPFFLKQWGKFGEDGKKRSKGENGHLLDGVEIFEMPADAYDRLRANGRAPDPRWTRIPKRAMLTPAERLEASAVPYVAKGKATASDEDYFESYLRGDKDTYENPQRLRKLVSETDRERLETEARWEALLGREV